MTNSINLRKQLLQFVSVKNRAMLAADSVDSGDGEGRRGARKSLVGGLHRGGMLGASFRRLTRADLRSFRQAGKRIQNMKPSEIYHRFEMHRQFLFL